MFFMMRLYKVRESGEWKSGIYPIDNLLEAEKMYYKFLVADIDSVDKAVVLDMVIDETGRVIFCKRFVTPEPVENVTE